jgi:hypothetical protein
LKVIYEFLRKWLEDTKEEKDNGTFPSRAQECWEEWEEKLQGHFPTGVPQELTDELRQFIFEAYAVVDTLDVKLSLLKGLMRPEDQALEGVKELGVSEDHPDLVEHPYLVHRIARPHITAVKKNHTS